MDTLDDFRKAPARIRARARLERSFTRPEPVHGADRRGPPDSWSTSSGSPNRRAPDSIRRRFRRWNRKKSRISVLFTLAAPVGPARHRPTGCRGAQDRANERVPRERSPGQKADKRWRLTSRSGAHPAPVHLARVRPAGPRPLASSVGAGSRGSLWRSSGLMVFAFTQGLAPHQTPMAGDRLQTLALRARSLGRHEPAFAQFPGVSPAAGCGNARASAADAPVPRAAKRGKRWKRSRVCWRSAGLITCHLFKRSRAWPRVPRKKRHFLLICAPCSKCCRRSGGNVSQRSRIGENALFLGSSAVPSGAARCRRPAPAPVEQQQTSIVSCLITMRLSLGRRAGCAASASGMVSFHGPVAVFPTAEKFQ